MDEKAKGDSQKAKQII